MSKNGLSLQSSKFKKYYIGLCVIILALTFYFGSRDSRPQGLEINVIQESDMQYGDTVLTGLLQKDTAPGIEGNYLLILGNNKLVLLDIQNIDYLVGAAVSVSGFLSPANTAGQPMTMSVRDIHVTKDTN